MREINNDQSHAVVSLSETWKKLDEEHDGVFVKEFISWSVNTLSGEKVQQATKVLPEFK